MQDGLTTSDYVSLREYVDTRIQHIVQQSQERFELHNRMLDARFQSLETAVELAREVLDIRLENTNKWRAMVDDVLKTTVKKDTHDVTMEALKSQINELQISRATLAGKAEQSSVNTATLLSIIGLLMGIISLIVKFASG